MVWQMAILCARYSLLMCIFIKSTIISYELIKIFINHFFYINWTLFYGLFICLDLLLYWSFISFILVRIYLALLSFLPPYLLVEIFYPYFLFDNLYFYFYFIPCFYKEGCFCIKTLLTPDNLCIAFFCLYISSWETYLFLLLFDLIEFSF